MRRKVLDCQNENVMITDRGTMSGYQDDFLILEEFLRCNAHYNGADVTIRCNSPTKRAGVTLAEDLI
jgi:2-dehydro-3-deoxyphosphooctonate aldolase (KDO 8-P synthase)